MDVADKNFYPKPFRSMEVTANDGAGHATTTKFYKNADKTSLVFTWTQVWDGELCTEWSVDIEEA